MRDFINYAMKNSTIYDVIVKREKWKQWGNYTVQDEIIRSYGREKEVARY